MDVNGSALKANVSRELTVAVLGAGSRGNEYTAYGKLFPGSLKVVAVADIQPARRDAMGEKWNIPAERRFNDWSELIAAGTDGKLADILMVCLPDDLHVAPALAGMRQGYDVLLEKPMAQTPQDCRALLACQKETGVMVALGHVLRYSPYYRALKASVDNGEIGELVSIQHMEPVLYAHMAHSFVRGNWRDSKTSTPMIVAKCCHDLDILKWIVGARCTRVFCEGGLYLFKSAKAPADAPKMCTEACPHEATCPYSVRDIYMKRKWFLYVFDLTRAASEEEIYERLRTSGYGRCVYHCDNNQPDHLVATLAFANGVTASFTMDAFTPWGGRRMRLMGTTGFIEGDGTTWTRHDFRTGEKVVWDERTAAEGAYASHGHAGGDLALVRDFLEAVDARDWSKLSSSLDASVESHLIGFACEQSRLKGTSVSLQI